MVMEGWYQWIYLFDESKLFERANLHRIKVTNQRVVASNP